MNAQKLYTQSLNDESFASYKESKIFYCSVCNLTYLDEEWAEKCCKCSICNNSIPENSTHKEPRGVNHIYQHPICSLNERKKIEKQRIEESEKIDYKDFEFGAIFYNDNYYYDWDVFFDDIINNFDDKTPTEEIKKEIPEYVYIAEEQNFKKICPDIDWFLDTISESGYYDIVNDLDGIDELKFSLNKFIDANKEKITYDFSYKKMVKVPPFDEKVFI